MNNILVQKRLNASHIKWIAIITMLIDHIGATIVQKIYFSNVTIFWENLYSAMRAIGRIAFPLFAFFIVEGFMHVKEDKKRLTKYIARLFLFIFISEAPFDMAFNKSLIEFGSQSVYITLFIGLLAISTMDFIKNAISNLFDKEVKKSNKTVIQALLLMIPYVASIYVFFNLAERLHTDYGGIGVLTIIVIYLLYKYKELGLLLAIMFLSMKNILEIFSIVDILFIWQYNGERGRQNKYFFYWFYPIHLTILALITKFLV